MADQRAGNEPNAQEGAHGEQPRAHDDTEANRRSPKLGGFAPNTSIGNEIAINKLRDMKYSISNCTASLPRVAANHTNQSTSKVVLMPEFIYPSG